MTNTRLRLSGKPPLFALGQVVATPGALAALEAAGQAPHEFLVRHVTGDWGDLVEEDVHENYHEFKGVYGQLRSSMKPADGQIIQGVHVKYNRTTGELLEPIHLVVSGKQTSFTHMF